MFLHIETQKKELSDSLVKIGQDHQAGNPAAAAAEPEYDHRKTDGINPCVRACEPEYVTGKPMVSEKENEAAVS